MAYIAAASITTMHIGGIFGNLSLGYLSDLIITRWPVSSLPPTTMHMQTTIRKWHCVSAVVLCV